MKDYEAYLFDWDGTLAKSLEILLGITRDILAEYGHTDIGDGRIVQAFGRLGQFAKELGHTDEEINMILDSIKQASIQVALEVPLYDSARDYLESLRNEGKRVALITTNWRDAVDTLLTNHQLTDLFDVVVTGDDVREAKPSPEGILYALDKLGVSKEQTVMFGDTGHDMGAAQNADIDRILFYPPSHQLFYDLKTLQSYQPVRILGGWQELITDTELT